MLVVSRVGNGNSQGVLKLCFSPLDGEDSSKMMRSWGVKI
jgi:hypothetical protein